MWAAIISALGTIIASDNARPIGKVSTNLDEITEERESENMKETVIISISVIAMLLFFVIILKS